MLIAMLLQILLYDAATQMCSRIEQLSVGCMPATQAGKAAEGNQWFCCASYVVLLLRFCACFVAAISLRLWIDKTGLTSLQCVHSIHSCFFTHKLHRNSAHFYLIACLSP